MESQRRRIRHEVADSFALMVMSLGLSVVVAGFFALALRFGS